MVELSIEALEQLQAKLNDPALGNYIQDTKAAGQSTIEMGEIISRVAPQTAEAIKNMAVQGGAALDFLSQKYEITKVLAVDFWNSMTGGAADYMQKQAEAGETAGMFGIKVLQTLAPIVNLLPKGTEGMGSFGRESVEAGQKLATSFAGVKPLVEGLGTVLGFPQLGAGAERMAEAADRGYAYQRALLQMAAAQGNLSGMITSSQNSFANLEKSMAEMNNMAYQTARATGQTKAGVMDLADAMKTIPRVLSESIDIGGVYINQLQATSQVAVGFGRKQSEVAGQLTKLYTTTGLSGQEAYETIARLYQAAGDSKLRFEGFNKSVMDIAGAFKMMGDNTEAATRVVKAFDTAFKESDISPAAMEQVISTMSQGVNQMLSTTEKMGMGAFVSGQTGGPGGLGGALQLELAAQEGNMEEVLQRTMTAMEQQFGGAVLTLQEAAESPALAAEFVKQREFLKMSGLAGTNQEANRLLEAMSTGVMDMIETGPTGEDQDALKLAVARGEKEQARTTTATVRIHQEMERFNVDQAQYWAQQNSNLNTLIGLNADMAGIKTGITGVRSLGVMGKGLEDIKPVTSEDNKRMMAEGMGALFNTVKDFAEQGKSVLSDKVQAVKETEEARLAKTPVGAGFAEGPGFAPPPVPGPTAGVGPIGGRPVPTAAPVEEKPITAQEAAYQEFFEGGEPGPFRIEHSPIRVEVDFGGMFEKKVQEIANNTYTTRESQRTQQAGMGSSQ